MKIQKFTYTYGTVRVPAESEEEARRKILANRCPEKRAFNDLVYVGTEERVTWPS